MAEYVGRDVIIPGSEWQPKQSQPAQGFIVKLTRPNGVYPKGRYEIYCVDDRQRYMFPVHKFPEEWILDSANFISLRSPSKSPARKSVGGSAVLSPPRGRTRAGSSAVKAARRLLSPEGEEQPVQAANVSTSPPLQSGMVTPVTVPTSPVRSPSPSQRRSPKRGRTPKSLLKSASTPSRNAGRGVRWLEVERAQESARKNFTVVPKLPMGQNLLNAAIMVAVALPALLVGLLTCTQWRAWVPQLAAAHPLLGWLLSPSVQQGLAWLSAFGRGSHPLWVVNVLLLLNVDVLFYVISRLQGNTWLIDPYWTIIPVMIQLFYANHPAAVADATRAQVAQWLLWAWSARLTYSYFRREEWQFGAREDWRYTDLARTHTRNWWWLSFLATYLVQHAMLWGITLPLYMVYTNPAPWGPWDTIAALAAAAGMCCSWVADNQLRAFMKANEERMRADKPLVLILETGLWKHSRHPNYFGEQLFWWGLGLFATGLGHPEVLCGALFNSLCMVEVTRMTEARMTRRAERRALYEEYQRRTNMWLPWPRAA